MTERFANDAQTTLDGAIDDTVAVLNVADASLFPTTGDFRIRVEDEYMLVTGVNSEEFTVDRAAEGSVAASHADTVDVTHVLTAGGLDARTSGLPEPLRVYDDDGLPVLSVVDTGTGDDRVRKVTLYSQTPWDPDAPEDGNIEALEYRQGSVSGGPLQSYTIQRNDGSVAIDYLPEDGLLSFQDGSNVSAVVVDPVSHMLRVLDAGGGDFVDLDGLAELFSLAGSMDLKERASAPDAPPADTARLYTEDLGGKTALYVRFPTGTPVKIAEEP